MGSVEGIEEDRKRTVNLPAHPDSNRPRLLTSILEAPARARTPAIDRDLRGRPAVAPARSSQCAPLAHSRRSADNLDRTAKLENPADAGFAFPAPRPDLHKGLDRHGRAR